MNSQQIFIIILFVILAIQFFYVREDFYGDSTSCPLGLTMQTNGRCICPQGSIMRSNRTCPCPVEQIWNSASGKCECTGGRIFQFDGKCACPSGQTFDLITRKCITNTCPLGQTLDLITGNCIPNTCPLGQTMQSDGRCINPYCSPSTCSACSSSNCTTGSNNGRCGWSGSKCVTCNELCNISQQAAAYSGCSC